MNGILRAHVHVHGITDEGAHAIRAAVNAWHATRHDLEVPRVLDCVAPVTEPDDDGWTRLHRWCTVTVNDPTPDDLLTLAGVLWPLGIPELRFTRDVPALTA